MSSDLVVKPFGSIAGGRAAIVILNDAEAFACAVEIVFDYAVAFALCASDKHFARIDALEPHTVDPHTVGVDNVDMQNVPTSAGAVLFFAPHAVGHQAEMGLCIWGSGRCRCRRFGGSRLGCRCGSCRLRLLQAQQRPPWPVRSSAGVLEYRLLQLRRLNRRWP